MKITLVHNPSAGSGQNADELVRLLSDAGHEVAYRPSGDGWRQLLQSGCELIVAAGGDGTVREVALAAADHGLPFAALPIGTANNVAKTLGMLGDARELVGAWSSAPRSEHPFDIGEVAGPWGRERFIEGVGGGPVAELIGRGAEVDADASLLGRETDRALHLLGELVREAPARRWQIEADGLDLSGDYLAVQVLNMRFVGPNVPLAPEASPTDGLLDLVLVGEADRAPLQTYLEKRLHLASGQLPEPRVVRARNIELVVPAGTRWHVDDRAWPTAHPLGAAAALSVRCLPAAATYIGERR